jgi:fucose permease
MPNTAVEPSRQLFLRDKLTWLGYLLIGYYCFIVASFGPIMPYLRDELHLSYTLASLHFCAPATGALFAGMIGEKVMAKLGRARTIWAGGCCVILGLLITLTAHHPLCTIFGAWLIGFTGAQMCQTITVIMSDRFKEERSIGITESNISAAIFCAAAPLAISFVSRNGLNWRIALIAPILMFVCLLLTNLKTIEGQSATTRAQVQSAALPPAYWAYFIVILLSVAAEWSIIFWSAEFLEKVVHLTKPDAAAGVSVFLVAMFAGRIIGSRLTRSVPTGILLPIASSLAAAGFILFWFGPNLIVHLTGLFLVGLGEANVYPLSLAAAIAVAPDQAAKASARMSMSSGLAILSAPLLLGMLADRSGISNAYGLVAVLLTMACAVVFVANKLARQHHAQRQVSLASNVLPDPSETI